MENKEQIRVRDLRNGDWFWLNKQILEHKRLNSSDKLVYCALAYFANNVDQSCFPSFSALVKLTGISKPTVAKSIKNLEKNKLIGVERKRGKMSVYKLWKTDWLKNLTSKNKEPHWLKLLPTLVKITTPNNTNKQYLFNNKENFLKFNFLKDKLKEKFSIK